MTATAQDWLAKLVDDTRPSLTSGAVSTYLPELSDARAQDLAVAVAFDSDHILTAGDSSAKFTVQSVVKVFSLLLALHHRGERNVFERVGQDQGVGAYNSLETFVRGSHIPANPFVNAGALVVTDMLPGGDTRSRVAHVVDLIRSMAGNHEIRVDMNIAASELISSDRNRALGYFLRSHGVITADIEELLAAYCQICAIEVDVVDLARASRVLASSTDVELPGGMVLRGSHLRLVRRLMLLTGMYEASGRYACEVGIPAKCGVSGAMIGAVCERMGIGIYGPALDHCANSIGGLRLMHGISRAFEID